MNGFCQCNSASGWYLDGSSCTQTCSGSLIKDALRYACVSSCIFPNEFIVTSGGVTSCEVYCPTN